MSSSEWSLQFHDWAKEAIEDADGSVQQRIRSALKQLRKAPVQRSKPLSGSLNKARSYRFGTPSGEYRILLRLDRSTQVIKVYYLGPREDFYKTVRRFFA